MLARRIMMLAAAVIAGAGPVLTFQGAGSTVPTCLAANAAPCHACDCAAPPNKVRRC